MLLSYSLWCKGLANYNTRSCLESSITAFTACHQSIQFIPLQDQHLFYSVILQPKWQGATKVRKASDAPFKNATQFSLLIWSCGLQNLLAVPVSCAWEHPAHERAPTFPYLMSPAYPAGLYIGQAADFPVSSMCSWHYYVVLLRYM